MTTEDNTPDLHPVETTGSAGVPGDREADDQQIATVSYLNAAAHEARMNRRKRTAMAKLFDDGHSPRRRRRNAAERTQTPEKAASILSYLECCASLLTDGGRFSRGMKYRDDRRVDGIFINGTTVEALVHGTQVDPFQVRLELPHRQPEELAARAHTIVAGDRIGSPSAEDSWTFLFRPDEMNQLQPVCSCPDLQTVCKHVVAVLAELGKRCNREADCLYNLRNLSMASVAELGGAVEFIDRRSQLQETEVYRPFNTDPPAPLPELPRQQRLKNPFDFEALADFNVDDIQKHLDLERRRDALTMIVQSGHHSMEQVNETIAELSLLWQCLPVRVDTGRTNEPFDPLRKQGLYPVK
ncbi:SWIM zinc finger family protein [Corynebacterium mendelii]|uniref:SWIM-type domain-containing protein n=1 Tax=Corynebacterium mendelii TaxID=2765362 RepID=A0A939E0V9_9CORY|nr:SWIM zinc finger family protein [Corynebacterium mendelii]MBN9644905.1 hypothetical protein [Corynebacterium mendelii]